MYDLQIENDLNIPNEDISTPVKDYVIERILPYSSGKAIELPRQTNTENQSIGWSPQQFLLPFSKLYKSLLPELQSEILIRCNQMLLSDFYFLEKSGLAYSSKMSLIVEDLEIKKLYALISRDEATHLEWVLPYVPVHIRQKPISPLISILSQAINESNVHVIYYVVQSLIEGWGYYTFHFLSQTCIDPRLTKVLKSILRDEMLHHKVGLALFDPKYVSLNDKRLIEDHLKNYADIFRAGPQINVHCFEQTLGELSKKELLKLFKDLKSKTVAKLNLKQLKSLVNQPGVEDIVQSLEDQGYFTPYSIEKSVEIYRSQYQQKKSR